MGRAREEESELHNATGQMTPPPGRQARCSSVWTTTGVCLPPGLTGSMRCCHRTRFCGAPWSRTSTPSCFRLAEVLQKVDTRSSPPGLSKCPRSFLSVLHFAVWRVVLRSWRNSWWKCRLTLLMPLELSSPLLLEEVFKVLSQNRILSVCSALSSSSCSSSSSGSAEVFKVYALDRIQQLRTWSRSLIFLHVAVFKVSPHARDQVVDIPVVVLTQIPMVRFTCAGPASSWETVEIPQLQLVLLWTVVACPLCPMTGAQRRTVPHCEEGPRPHTPEGTRGSHGVAGPPRDKPSCGAWASQV